ncbi:MAG: GTPase HflX [Treponema sp.]|nr:GTPase HflX [Treponema sp.]
MVNVQEEQEKKPRCLLVGAPNKNDEEPKELKGLVDTLGMETVQMVVLARIEPNPVYGIGTGKAQEIVDRAKEVFADCIIFDWEISPSKQRNWERLAGINVFDRNEVIIRIFAQRARTKEAALQVQLAQLTYSLPRLSHMYGNLARQRGGNYGAKGSGETQLELDRRQIEDNILQIKKELEQVSVNRQTQRRQRERTSVATCALVGYTNAGKSSLLNALTGAEAFVEDKLFATLDPTTRKFSISEAAQVLLTDTVGFISNLPHTLIDAFRSTLEEASLADLLLVVVDSSDEKAVFQYAQVLKVLEEIHADGIPRMVVLNKIDKISGDHVLLANLDAHFPGAVHVCAKTGEGFDTLVAGMTENLLGAVANYLVPVDRSDLVEAVRKNGTIESEEWLDDGVHLVARIPGHVDSDGKFSTKTLALLKPYQVKNLD